MGLARKLPPVELLNDTFDIVDGQLVCKATRPRDTFNSDQGYRYYLSQCVGKVAGSEKWNGSPEISLAALGRYTSTHIIAAMAAG